MTEKQQLRLLGSFQVGEPPGITLRRKNRAILAYLALSSRPLGRFQLAALFCQSAADPAHTLRLSLSRLRGKLGKNALLFEGETVQFNRDCFQTDVYPFQEQLDRPSLQPIPTETLQQAISLYRGNFLDGLHLPDAPEFEMWLVGRRSYYQHLYEKGALALLKRLTAESPTPPASALSLAQHLVRHNPLLEEAHYYLIRLYAQAGRRSAALEQFDQCRAILKAELAVEPTPDLLDLYRDIQAGRVVQRRPSIPPQPALSSASAVDFVGREAEWQQLDKAWAEVQGGSRRAVLITAEAGGGKTRLMQEWAKQLSPGTFLYSPCYETTQTLPYHPFLPILEQLYKRLDSATLEKLAPTMLDTLARLIPDLAQRDAPPGHQDQLLSAVSNLLGLLNQRLTIFLDDLQWADAATLRLLHFLVIQRVTPHFFVVAFRSEEANDNPALLKLLRDWARHTETLSPTPPTATNKNRSQAASFSPLHKENSGEIQTLHLAPLSADSVAQLMQRLWPQLPEGYREPHLRDRLLQATGGNPLFVNEIIRELAGSSQLPETLPVPPSLRELIQRRLRELPASSRQVLESLAVLEQPAEFDLIRQISGRSEDEALTALEMGIQRRLLISTQASPSLVDFSHDLMGQAVRELLNPIRRQLLHRRTAKTLAGTDVQAATLAFHWKEAGDAEKEAAAAMTAGQEAAALYANEEAIYFYERVLALRPSTAAWRHLGEVRRRIGRWDEAEAAFQEALSLAQSPHDEAEANLALGKLALARSNYEAGKRYLETAERFFQQHNQEEELADCYNSLAIAAYYQSDYQTALDYYQMAFDIDKTLSDTEGMIKRLGNMGLVYLQWGQLDQAQNLLEQSLKIARDIKHQEFIANRLSNLGVVVSKRGNQAGALALYKQAVDIDESLGNTQSVARSLGNMGVDYYSNGDYTLALAHWDKAMAMEREMGNTRAEARLLGNISEARQDFGDFEQAERYLALALKMDLTAQHWKEVTRSTGNLAQLYLRQGRFAEAAQWVEPALALARRLSANSLLADNLYTAAQIAYQQEAWQTAETHLQECLSLVKDRSDRPIYLSATILLHQTHVRQQKITAAAATEQFQSLLNDYTDPADLAALHDAIWQLDPTNQTVRQKAADYYQTAHDRFPHILYRQRHAALTGVTLPSPNITLETADLPDPLNLNHLHTQLTASITK
ncbi:MAG: tetratricopeptide repeat protein [Candidatus Promineifilaceae bacterium]